MKKVQFTRTVALEDIPKEVAKLLRESGESFKTSTTGTFSLLEQELVENENYTQFLKNLDELRAELASADTVLEDCKNIIAGYIQILTSPEQPEQDNLTPEDRLRQMKQVMQDIQQGGGE